MSYCCLVFKKPYLFEYRGDARTSSVPKTYYSCKDEHCIPTTQSRVSYNNTGTAFNFPIWQRKECDVCYRITQRHEEKNRSGATRSTTQTPDTSDYVFFHTLIGVLEWVAMGLTQIPKGQCWSLGYFSLHLSLSSSFRCMGPEGIWV